MITAPQTTDAITDATEPVTPPSPVTPDDRAAVCLDYFGDTHLLADVRQWRDTGVLPEGDELQRLERLALGYATRRADLSFPPPTPYEQACEEALAFDPPEGLKAARLTIHQIADALGLVDWSDYGRYVQAADSQVITEAQGLAKRLAASENARTEGDHLISLARGEDPSITSSDEWLGEMAEQFEYDLDKNYPRQIKMQFEQMEEALEAARQETEELRAELEISKAAPGSALEALVAKWRDESNEVARMVPGDCADELEAALRQHAEVKPQGGAVPTLEQHVATVRREQEGLTEGERLAVEESYDQLAPLLARPSQPVAQGPAWTRERASDLCAAYEALTDARGPKQELRETMYIAGARLFGAQRLSAPVAGGVDADDHVPASDEDIESTYAGHRQRIQDGETLDSLRRQVRVGERLRGMLIQRRKDAEAEVSRLLAEVSANTEAFASYQDLLVKHTDRMTAAESEVTRLKQELAETSRRLKQRSADLEATTVRKATAEQTAADWQGRAEAAEKRAAEAEASRNLAADREQDSEKRAAELERDVCMYIADWQDIAGQRDTLRAELAKVRELNHELGRAHKAAEAELAACKQELAVAVQHEGNVRTALRATENELAACKAKLDRLREACTLRNGEQSAYAHCVSLGLSAPQIVALAMKRIQAAIAATKPELACQLAESGNAKSGDNAKCAVCNEVQAEHHYNGACYGLCGKFVSKFPVKPAEPSPVEPDPDAPKGVEALPSYWDARRKAQGKPDASRCGAELRVALAAVPSAVDVEALARRVERHDDVLRMLCAPGGILRDGREKALAALDGRGGE
jgi:uncharacterized protein YdbL (DUF1318 family)